ncbi:MAG: patatin-like phospholipase family protein [Nanobdellota archaeon]
MKKKLAIIMSGGGINSVYGAGALLALKEKYKVKPDILICGSGSAGNGAYYLSGQYNSILEVWKRFVPSKKFINFKRFWKIVDVNYLIDSVFKKHYPLDVKKVIKSKIRFFIPALNKKTGSINYFENKKGIDLFECLRATKALPIIYKINPNIKIGDSYYCDSPISSNGESHIKKAAELGAKKILIINNFSYRQNRLYDKIFYLWLNFQKLKRRYLKTQKQIENYDTPNSIHIFRLYPKSNLKINLIKNNYKKINKTIKLGYNDTINNKNLEYFLNYKQT